MFEGPCLNGRFGKTDRETVYRYCQPLCTMGRKTWRQGVPHEQNCAVCGDNLAKINMIYHFYAPGQLEYSSIDKMAKYDWSTFRNYVAFLAGELAPGTRHPHHISESSSCYHDAFQPWGQYHNNIVLFYHDSPITRSHFMDPTDRAIKEFYCNFISLIFQLICRIVAWALAVRLLSSECHKSQHVSDNGMMLSNNKSLPEPMLTQIYFIKSYHKAKMHWSNKCRRLHSLTFTAPNLL